MQLLDAWSPQLLSVLRIGAGLCFIEHGLMKLFDFPAPLMPGPLPPLLLVAAVIEVAGGTLIIVGLFTKIAAFLCAGQMAIAYFGFHVFHGLGNAPGPVSFDPVVNKGTEAALEAIIFLYLAAAGGGAWSLDAVLRRRAAA